jgi:hypothetical protein
MADSVTLIFSRSVLRSQSFRPHRGLRRPLTDRLGEVGAVFVRDHCIDFEVPLFSMEPQREPVGQQCLKHPQDLVAAGRRCDLRDDVVSLKPKPFRRDKLISPDAIRREDKVLQIPYRQIGGRNVIARRNCIKGS